MSLGHIVVVLDVCHDALNQLSAVIGSPLLCNLRHQYILPWCTKGALQVGIVLGLGDPERFAYNVVRVLFRPTQYVHAPTHMQQGNLILFTAPPPE